MKTYRLIYKCGNCWERFNVDIPFGKEALPNLNCINCGMNWASPDRQKNNDIPEWCCVLDENDRLVTK